MCHPVERNIKLLSCVESCWTTLYRSTLLSTLVAIRYDDPIDTIHQMVESGLPFGVLENSAIEWLAKTDPRDTMKVLNDRRHLVKWNGTVSEETFKK